MQQRTFVFNCGWLVLAVCAALVGCDGSILSSNPVVPGAPGTPNPPDVIPVVPEVPGVGVAAAGTIRRLNRGEYNNTVRDLLGDLTLPADTFPTDNIGSFDNNADVLTISPTLAEKYVSTAESLITAALGATNPARAKILSCTPAITGHDPCARKIIGEFGLRAWRRPLLADEVDRLFALVAIAEGQGDNFETGISLALQAALVDPNFVFRVELDPDINSPVLHRLNDYELASRVSYFLLGSMPDSALFAAAGSGTLKDPVVLKSQVERILSDPKATALVDGFGTQWLRINDLATAAPSADVYPGFNEPLRLAMAEETRRFFSEYLTSGLDYRGMLDSDFTFVNAPLATLYGIPGVTGSAFTRVAVGNTNRSGLLGKASILTVTSTPVRSSIAKRGKFVLTQLLCQPPGEPPVDVPVLPDVVPAGETYRQQLERVTANGVCKGCHQMLNPLGGGLGHFDGIGAYRDLDNGLAVDASGKLPNGTTFDGHLGEAKALKANPAFESCVTGQMMNYALGRNLATQERPFVLAISKEVDAKGNHLKDLVQSIVASDLFSSRRGGVN